jgi:RND superfamily putative drug exporter
MGILAIPVLSMQLGLPDAGSSPVTSTERRAYDLIAEGFGPGFNGQLSIIVDLDGVADADTQLAAIGTALTGYDGIVRVLPAAKNDTGTMAVISVIPATGPSAPETDTLAHDLRNELRPGLEAETGTRFFVAGSTATNTRSSDSVSSSTSVSVSSVASTGIR